MTAVSRVDQSAATTEISSQDQPVNELQRRMYDIYVQTLRELSAIAEQLWQDKVAERHTLVSSIWEHHAVSIGGTRQTGKSTAIAHLSNPEDLIVVYNSHDRPRMIELLRTFHGGDHADVVTASTLRSVVSKRMTNRQGQMPLPFRNPARIYIDDSRWVFSNGLSLSMREFSRFVLAEYAAKLPTVICVG